MKQTTKRLLAGIALAGILLTSLALTPASTCAGDFCADCEAQADQAYNNALTQPGANGCDADRAFVEHCWAQCPTCKFCDTRIRKFNYFCL